MPRSEAVRQEVLSLDDHRCQITGARGSEVQLNVHHVIPLGGGGSEALDTVDNGITLAQTIHMDGVHPGVSVPTVRILRCDRTDKEGGLIVERREGADDDWHEWPKSELWFYERQRTEHLELVEARIQGLSAIEGDVAKDLWELSEGYPLLDPDAVSFAQYAAARGWSSNKAGMGARAFAWVEKYGLTWAVGLTAEKVDILRKASSKLEPNLLPAIWQELIDGAVDQSIADLKRALISKGYKSASMRWYLLIGEHKRPLGRVQTDTLFVRSRDYEIVMNRMGAGVKVVEVNSFKAGIRWDRKAQKLYDRTGNEIAFETWEAADV